MDRSADHEPREGVTLVELILVVAIVTAITAAMATSLRAVHQGWQVGDRRSEVLQNARVGMEEMTRILRQLPRVSSVSDPTDTSGFVEFYDKDYVLARFDLDSQTNYLRYGPAGDLSLLAGPVETLSFACYDSAGLQLSAPVACTLIRSMDIALTVADAEGQANAITLTSKVFLREDTAAVVINEIMYNPSGNDEKYEWIELYNLGGPVDVAGWKLISTGNQAAPDTLEGDDRFGSGDTILPQGSYAVVTDGDSEVNAELLQNRGFETGQMTMWVRSDSWSRVKDGDAHEGQRKLARDGSGWVCQEKTLPAAAVSAFFSCWEKTPSPIPADTRLVITVRNTSNVVLSTLYDGPMHSTWTRHTADFTPYIGTTVRIYFETGSSGTYWIDDVSMSWSYVDKDALRLRVDDNDVGGGLKDDSDTVTLMNGGVDMVTYQDVWGGDGNNRTLERIDPAGDPMASANWTEGPVNGTPGRINQASQP